MHQALRCRGCYKRGLSWSARSSERPVPASNVSGGTQLRARRGPRASPSTLTAPSSRPTLHSSWSVPLTSQPSRHNIHEGPRRPASCSTCRESIATKERVQGVGVTAMKYRKRGAAAHRKGTHSACETYRRLVGSPPWVLSHCCRVRAAVLPAPG